MTTKKTINDIIGIINQEVESIGRPDLYRGAILCVSSATDPLYDELKTIVGQHALAPREILPDANSVITWFVPFTKEVEESSRTPGWGLLKWQDAFWWMSGHRETIEGLVCDYLRGKGYQACSAKSNFYQDKEKKAPRRLWCQKSAAYIGGLGTFGLNRLMITDKGCGGFFMSVLTSAVLPPGEKKKEPICDYFRDGSCRLCIKMCPGGALSEERIDRVKCKKYFNIDEDGLSDNPVPYDRCIWGNCLRACPYLYIE